jgi:hypothetical protein
MFYLYNNVPWKYHPPTAAATAVIPTINPVLDPPPPPDDGGGGGGGGGGVPAAEAVLVAKVR